MRIMAHADVQQKIRRMARQILENNFDVDEIVLAGINNNGLGFASLLVNELVSITDVPVRLIRIRLNPANPIDDPVVIQDYEESLSGKTIIIVDDVANTGRTIFYSIKPLLDVLPKKVEAAVLIDRQHKSFPIRVDYVGVSLATTLNENIDVHLDNPDQMEVYLN